MKDIADRAPTDVRRIEAGPDGGIRLDLLGMVRYPIGFLGGGHSHDFWELIFVTSGKGRLEGGHSPRPCMPDDLILVAPGQSHQFRAAMAWPLEMLYLGFSVELPAGLRLPASPVFLSKGPVSDDLRKELRELLPLVRQCGDAEELRRAMVRFLPSAARAAMLLHMQDSSGQDPMTGSHDKLVRAVKTFVGVDLALSVSMAQLARRFHLSPPYLGEIFKRGSGMSVKEYQRNLRLTRSLDLIRGTGRPITHIAAEVGMGEAAYFSRAFKRRFGITPRQARRNPDSQET